MRRWTERKDSVEMAELQSLNSVSYQRCKSWILWSQCFR